MYGWRKMYQIAGIIGVTVGILSLIVLREPKRGVYDFAK
jgi:uncharacterized membrane protein YkgB